MTSSSTVHYLRSLLISIFISFLAPLILVGSAIVLLLLIGLLPGFTTIAQAGASQVLAFLGTFGNGSAWEGIGVIGCACALVGALFDTYTFTLTTGDRSSNLSK